MSKFVIDDIISLTMYDKDGQPVWHSEDVDAIETESESMTFVGKPKIGDHVYLEAYKKNQSAKFVIDGFYGDDVDENRS